MLYMNNYIVLGDIHGDVEMFKKMVTKCEENNYGLICIGDYTDSIDFSKKHQKQLLHEMICTYNLWKEKPIYLVGNHDIHYMTKLFNKFRTTDWSRSKHELFFPIYMEMFRNGMLQFHHTDIANQILYTHAGLEKDIMLQLLDKEYSEFESITIEEVDSRLIDHTPEMWEYLFNDKKYVDDLNYMLFDFGEYSGGIFQGGIFWCRPQEMEKNLPEGKRYPFTQVVGHTKIAKIYYESERLNTYFIDTLHDGTEDKQYLLVENGKVTIQNVDDE